MSMRNKLTRLFVLLLAAFLVLGACTAFAAGRDEPTAEPVPTPGPMDAAQELVDYLDEHGELPENFIRKRDAELLGWKTQYRYVSDLGAGKAIGGDYFDNYEEQLPVVKGRKYYEADCYYLSGPRNAYRLIYSNDGHYYYTGDHYETFEELFPSKK